MRCHFLSTATICIILTSVLNSANAQTTAYRPLGAWVNSQQAAVNRWDANLQRNIVAQPKTISPAARPRIAGLKPKPVELLEDALLRKSARRITTMQQVQQHIIRMSENQAGRNVLNGALNEALFLERNPEWGYVKASNAPQHDVYRWIAGRRTPFNGQLKFHADGNPATYAADMKRDVLAHRFFVPEDHVDTLKAYLRAKAERLARAGDNAGAKAAWRDYGRVRGTKVTSTEVITGTRYARKYELRQKYMTYISLGAAIALAAGPIVWDWANGDLPANQAMYQSTRVLSILGVGVGTDLALRGIGQGALRGSLRGTLIVGAALTIVETTWLLYEYGWTKAWSNPDFYESVGGSVAGLALGLAASGAAVVWIPGPGWVVGSGAILAGGVAYAVGSVGGRAATRMIFEIMAPETLQKQIRDRIDIIKSDLALRMQTLQQLENRIGT